MPVLQDRSLRRAALFAAKPLCGTLPDIMNREMEEVRVGVVGLGNVGSGTLAVLADNADQIALKLGFRLKVAAVCSRTVASKSIPEALGQVFKPAEWRQAVEGPYG